MTATTNRQRIAIIGCGYVGSALGKALVKAGHDVVGTTTTSARVEELRGLGIEPAVLRHAATERFHELLQDREAAVLTIAPSGPERDYRAVYLDGARHFLKAAEHTAVRRVIYTSSTRVYGQNDGSWVDECLPNEPRDENGRILLETERALLEGGKKLGGEAPAAVTVVRLGALYGPGRDMAEFVQRASGQQRDDGDGYVNWIHRDDVVAALGRLLGMPYHGILNLCDDHPIRRRELYDRMTADAGLPPVRWISPSGPPELGKRVRNNLIKRTLGLSLAHPSRQV